jgi:hypothetical protein
MKMKRSNKIYWRAVISFYIIIAFVVMGVSGIILYFAPPGRVAFWSDWRFIALTKAQWQAIHTIFTFIFVAATAFHIYFNWSVITSYLRKKMNEGMKRRNELILASAFSLFVMAFTVGNVPPFSTVMEFGEELSDSWSDENTEPPVPHAELLTLTEFSEVIKTDVDQFIHSLKTNGVNVPAKEITLEELAELNGLTPQDVYERAKTKLSTVSAFAIGSGYGRKSISEISKDLNIELELILNRLKKNGIDAQPNNNLKELASKYDRIPIDIVEIIKLKTQIEQNNM